MNYQTFRNEYVPAVLPELKLYRPCYPHGECAVIKGAKNKAARIRVFCEKENLLIYDYNELTVISTLKTQTDKTGTSYIFSGLARWQDKLIVGAEDIEKNKIAVEDIRECIGEFELIIFKEENFELSTDYFGIGKWCYYQSDDVFVTATSYHLLLLTLINLDIKMKLNTKKVSAGMAFFGRFAENSFTDEMDIEDCYMMLPDRRMIISPNSEPIYEETALFHEIHSPKAYTEEEYEKYLFKAKDEIIANIRTILEHPRFDYAHCDITGGMDTRLVIAAITNLPRSLTEKVRFFCYNSLESDYKTANAIANAFGFKWLDIPRKMTKMGIEIHEGVFHQASQSYNLGTYYLSNYLNYLSFFQYERLIKITGDCGESMFRQACPPYNYSLTEDALFQSFGFVIDVPKTSKAQEYFEQFLRKSILTLPGKSINEKLQTYNIYYRIRYHTKSKYKPSSPLFMPLQSKAAFRCKNMYHTHRVDDKFQFDLITLLNPLLANFPYGNEEPNIYLNKFSDYLYGKGFPKVSIIPDFSVNTPNFQKTFYTPDFESLKDHYNALIKWYKSDETLLSALKVFLEYSEDFEELGEPLYKYFTCSRNEKGITSKHNSEYMRINRILSAYWQIRVI